ncbi:hypothetical protein NHQ30_007824 [Ciborinia camelliae]|nr:hypothetical protein NHQ30_007824 [Ciborinia camelliae]
MALSTMIIFIDSASGTPMMDLAYVPRCVVNQSTISPRGTLRLNPHIANPKTNQLNEAQGSHSPSEPNLGQQLLHHNGKNNAPRRASGGGNPNGQTLALTKIRTQRRQGGTEETPIPETHADALGEKDLPVGGRDGGHEDAEETQDGTGEEDGAEVAGVGQAAGEGPDEEEQEYLHGADPGDGGGGELERADVVGLEDAEGVYEAPGGGVC